ncbi:OLC1v1002784C1 [Oldenlandia corymbosa var. corymbosa]|uniref:OLC1v1002784C1 n=1 Tax=Oldenlandia corymbosa var. corymbosa TaxID=529605 RepID=A0AAV1D8K4_OLDCO|nr:OLC1v1002784C1 [Oldenlandia corymbosa var. corymbosa]
MEAAGTMTSGKNLSLLPSGYASTFLRANPKVSSSFLFLKPQSRNNNVRICSSGRVKCSYDYFGSNNNNNTSSFNNYDGFMGSQQYPKPTEIQWKKELCNTVQLIGIVATPVQIKQLSSGKALAWSRLAVKKSQTDTIWINLTFWDELAHVASQHLEKGQQIYVSGRLVSDTVESDDGKQQTYYKVVVQQLNFVERGAAPVALYDGDSSAPTSGRKLNSNAANSPGSVEELWQAFFANPVEWWDNRKNKRSPNYPDFKHKDTGEALWVQGRYNPPWVKSQLAILDARMESFHEQNGSKQLSYMTIDNL